MTLKTVYMPCLENSGSGSPWGQNVNFWPKNDTFKNFSKTAPQNFLKFCMKLHHVITLLTVYNMSCLGKLWFGVTRGSKGQILPKHSVSHSFSQLVWFYKVGPIVRESLVYFTITWKMGIVSVDQLSNYDKFDAHESLPVICLILYWKSLILG